jgi:hypothetical protein
MNETVAIALAILKSRKKKKKELPFPEQDAFISDPSQFIAAETTRRAGKTTALAKKFKIAMDKYPNSLCRYIALTRDSAKDIMWPVLQELDEMYQWKAEFTDSNLTMKLPNGAKLKLLGADQKNFIKRLRGAKSPAVGIDEAQDYAVSLEELVDDILTPSIADYPDSWIAVTGTPGPIPRGYFHDITQGGKHGFSVHRWSLYQNPYMPNAQAFVDDLKKRKGWDEKHPTYLREYKGTWVLDLQSLLVKYDASINHYDSLPAGKLNYITGVDLGIKDSDALATIAWADRGNEIYLVEEEINSGEAISELAERLDRNRKKYNPQRIPTDEGALGKKIAEEIRRRFHIPLEPAEKSRKMETVRFLNDYLRRGLFKAKKDSRFVEDSYRVQIDQDKSTADRIVLKKGFHSDIIDAVLYAFKESPAFIYRKPDDIPREGSAEWAKAETEKMQREAEEELNKQEKPWWEIA